MKWRSTPVVMLLLATLSVSNAGKRKDTNLTLRDKNRIRAEATKAQMMDQAGEIGTLMFKLQEAAEEAASNAKTAEDRRQGIQHWRSIYRMQLADKAQLKDQLERSELQSRIAGHEAQAKLTLTEADRAREADENKSLKEEVSQLNAQLWEQYHKVYQARYVLDVIRGAKPVSGLQISQKVAMDLLRGASIETMDLHRRPAVVGAGTASMLAKTVNEQGEEAYFIDIAAAKHGRGSEAILDSQQVASEDCPLGDDGEAFPFGLVLISQKTRQEIGFYPPNNSGPHVLGMEAYFECYEFGKQLL